MQGNRAGSLTAAGCLAVLAGGLLLATIGPAPAEEIAATEIGGLLFGDIYYVDGHHMPESVGALGAVLRRGYLTLNSHFAGDWDARLRLELNQSGDFEDYSFELRAKDLFVAHSFGRHRFVFGLSPTPTFDLLESYWGRRYLLRTPMDLQGVASRDTGISAQGPLNATGALSYRAMLGAGLELGNETGDGTKGMAAITWRPDEHWAVDVYADYERLPGPADRRTWQIFAGYRDERLSFGAQYSDQDRQDDPPLELASAYATLEWSASRSIIARVDRLLESSPTGNNISYLPFDPSSRATMFVGGLEFRLTGNLRITPNIVYTHYDRDDEGVRPDSDRYARLTFFVDYE